MTKDEALKLALEALKIARDQIVDPEYAPIGWSVSRLDEVLANGQQALAAPDLQAELDATNRQVEILSDALAESRREVDALVALARADEREACAKVCDDIGEDLWSLYKGRAPYTGKEEGRADMHVQGKSDGADECAAAIRARGETK
jgi:hypothetical protein